MYNNMEDYYYPEMNPNPKPNSNPNFTNQFSADINQSSEFELLQDFLIFNDDHGFDHDHEDSSSHVSTHVASSETMSFSATASSITGAATGEMSNIKCKKGGMKKKCKLGEGGHRVAFKTKSDLEVMDDGFKWRKYGKKSVKNSPNPRNYYKCSSVGCQVKKRVERDREDHSFVITTYDGIHNHESPCAVYHNQMPFNSINPSTAWTLQMQVSSPPSSSSS